MILLKVNGENDFDSFWSGLEVFWLKPPNGKLSVDFFIIPGSLNKVFFICMNLKVGGRVAGEK